MANKKQQAKKEKQMAAKKSNSTVAARADLKSLIQRAALAGVSVVLAVGITYTGCNVSDLGDITIIGNAVTIDGQLKFEKCGKVTLDNFIVTNGNPYGVMVVNCKGFTAQGLAVHGPQRTGILVANTSNVLIDGCHCSGAKEQHGIYISQSCDNVTVQHSVMSGNAFSGLQINAVQDDANPKAKDSNQDSMSKVVNILHNTIIDNQQVGKAGALQLSGCYEVTIIGNAIKDHWGRAGITLWDDGTGKPELSCHGVRIEDNDFDFRQGVKPLACISAGKGCTNVVQVRNDFPQDVSGVVIV